MENDGEKGQENLTRGGGETLGPINNNSITGYPPSDEAENSRKGGKVVESVDNNVRKSDEEVNTGSEVSSEKRVYVKRYGMSRPMRADKVPGRRNVGKRRLVEGEDVVVRDMWWSKMRDIKFFGKGIVEQARELGIHPTTVDRWKKLVSAEEWVELRDFYRSGYARYAPIVDAALVNKAMRGDMKAVELFYQRHEGWSQKNSLDITARNGDLAGKSVEELMGEAEKLVREHKGLVE